MPSIILKLKQDKLALLCLLIITLIILIGIFAPWLAPHDPTLAAIKYKFKGISAEYWLGTDHLGRCIFSRLIYGIRTTLFASIFAISVTISIGCLIGFIAGYFRGRVDAVLMRVCDVMLSFPSEVMILALVGMLGPGLGNMVLAIVVIKWAWYARMIRCIVLSYNENNYVRYAKAIGCSPFYIIRTHFLSMTAAEIIIFATVDIGSVILTISALSFLGLGVQAPTPEWGMMLSEAKNVMFTHPELMLPAGLMIVITVSAFNFLGDFLRDYLDSHHSLNQQEG